MPGTKHIGTAESFAVPPTGVGGMTYVKLAADRAAFTATTLANIAGLSFPVTSGQLVNFEARVIFRSAATGTGLKLGLTCPAFSMFAAAVQTPIAADGAAAMFSGWLTSSGDSVTGTGVQAINTDYIAVVRGTILPSANGTVQLQGATEIAASNVIVRAGSNLGWLVI